MILLAAITEAMIYFIVRRLKTPNPWNHVFISYLLGALLFSNASTTNVTLSLAINAVIGLVGYLLRFMAISNLTPIVYSFLSYVGVIMAFIYGVIFSHEAITIPKLIATLFILVPSIKHTLQKM